LTSHSKNPRHCGRGSGSPLLRRSALAYGCDKLPIIDGYCWKILFYALAGCATPRFSAKHAVDTPDLSRMARFFQQYLPKSGSCQHAPHRRKPRQVIDEALSPLRWLALVFATGPRLAVVVQDAGNGYNGLWRQGDGCTITQRVLPPRRRWVYCGATWRR
jgi:hypothetical protein